MRNKLKDLNEKRKKSLFAIVFALIMLLSLSLSIPNTAKAASKNAIKTVTLRVNGVKVNSKTIAIYKGSSAKVAVTVNPGSSKKSISYSTSSKKVAAVSKGTITGKSVGTAKISVKVRDRAGRTKTVWLKVRVVDRWKEILDKYSGNDNVKQLVFVKYTGGSKAKVMMYSKKGNKWKCILECQGYVGKNGINKTKEGDKKTPTGVFNLTGAFGIKSNPGTSMPYIEVNKYHYWCGDKEYYNQLVDTSKISHKCNGEHLIDYVPQYNYGMILDYNSKGTYKKGSAIFLHCKGKNSYTLGCIAVSQNNMIKILKNAEQGAKICIYKN